MFGGFPGPGQGGGDRVPVPLDGRRPRCAPAPLPPHPAPAGASRTRHPRCALRAATGTGFFRAGIPWKTEGRPSPSQRLFRNAGRRRGQRLRRLPETKSCLSFPFRPARAFGFLLFFCPFFIFPYPSPKGCLLFPSSFQASGLQNQTVAPSERRLSSSDVRSRSKLISQHWGIFRLAVN